jgi:hypothetical protein
MSCEYVRQHYGVPACIGRRVIACGEPGIIAEDRGHYIGVNLDKDKPGVIGNYHPTHQIEYLDMGKVRKMTKSQQRYKRWLEYGDGFDSFREFLGWDADPEHSWNCGV